MNQKLRNLVYTAMLMALCCVATLVIKIPTVTGGYLNAGDIVVVLAALLAGPLYGGVAAGFGSGLADVISGYMSYAPGTLVVKGCAAVVTALIFRACRKKSFGFALLSAICGEIIMVLGYFVFEDFILGYGAAAAAAILERDVVRAGAGARDGDQARLKGIAVQVGRAQDQAIWCLYVLPDDAAALFELLQAIGGYMVHGFDFIHDVLPQTVSDNPRAHPRPPSAWRYKARRACRRQRGGP